MKIHVLHEHPGWYAPFAAAFDAEGIPHQQWPLGEFPLDLGATPPGGIFWSRMSASAHTRGHPLAGEHARAVLCWLEAYGRRVVNGRSVLEFEMSKVDQLTALNAAGLDVPRTVAVAGKDGLAAAAGKLPVPFISKPNRGGTGHGVRRFDSHADFAEYLGSPEYEAPADGITLLQEYVQPAKGFITRVEVVGGRVAYAITADTVRGGFELCPADACAAGEPDGAGLFELREDFDHPIVARYLDFARWHGIEIAGFEFIETADGRLVTYDVNTNTNYNPAIEAAAPRSAAREVARFLRRLLEAEIAASGPPASRGAAEAPGGRGAADALAGGGALGPSGGGGAADLSAGRGATDPSGSRAADPPGRPAPVPGSVRGPVGATPVPAASVRGPVGATPVPADGPSGPGGEARGPAAGIAGPASASRSPANAEHEPADAKHSRASATGEAADGRQGAGDKKRGPAERTRGRTKGKHRLADRPPRPADDGQPRVPGARYT